MSNFKVRMICSIICLTDYFIIIKKLCCALFPTINWQFFFEKTTLFVDNVKWPVTIRIDICGVPVRLALKFTKLTNSMVTYTDIQSPFFILFVRVILPNGLPEEFSTACTFRARKLPKYTWHIIRIVDMENEPQFLIAMNPKIQTLDLSVKNQTGELETVSFSADRVSKIFTTLLEIMLLIRAD